MTNESNDSDKSQAALEEPSARAASAPSMNVWARIKEHKIAQWTLAYAAAAYALLDGTKIVSEAFDWPHQVLRVVTALLILGLPLVVTIAWYHGHRALRRVSGAELTIITVLLVMAGSVLWHFAHPSEGSPATKGVPTVQATAPAANPGAAAPAVVISDKSVAVLPFLDMSEKQDEGYFSDGLSEELIDMLTKVPGLQVPARTSSFYFKGKQTTIKDIAVALSVAHVLEGSVRKSGKTLRITAQLIRVDNGYHLWSETFDRKLDDIFKIQDEIAGEVVKALKVSLLASAAPLASRTSATDAYLLYLKGSALFRNQNEVDSVASVTTLKESVKLDPDYAPAWAMLGRAIASNYRLQGGDYMGASAATRAAAERAIKLDPRLPDAYVALAFADLIDWRWDALDAEVKKALALQPDSPLALKFASYVPLVRGQTDAALRYAEAALVRDPLDALIYNDIAAIQNAMGRYSMAEAAARKSQELNPAQGSFHSTFAYYHFMNGDPAAALAEIRQEPDELSRLFVQIVCLDALGRRAEADADLAVFLKKYAATAPISTAEIYALRREKDLAFEWLERAYRQHDYDLNYVKVQPDLRSLRTDPRFNSLLRKMNLLE